MQIEINKEDILCRYVGKEVKSEWFECKCPDGKESGICCKGKEPCDLLKLPVFERVKKLFPEKPYEREIYTDKDNFSGIFKKNLLEETKTRYFNGKFVKISENRNIFMKNFTKLKVKGRKNSLLQLGNNSYQLSYIYDFLINLKKMDICSKFDIYYTPETEGVPLLIDFYEFGYTIATYNENDKNKIKIY